jgi:uncharacterized protein
MMIFTHFFTYIVNKNTPAFAIFAKIDTFSSWYCVPLFYFIVGYNSRIQINRKLTAAYSKTEVANHIWIRGLAIYFLGFILNIYQVGLSHVWHWSTLQIIAVGYIMTYFLHNFKNYTLIMLIILVLVLSFMLAPYYGYYQYNGEWNFKGFLFGFVFSGGNPLLPWIAYFIMGNFIADLRVEKTNKIVLYVLFISLIVFSVVLRNQMPITKYPASITYNFIFLSSCPILFYVIFWFRETKNWNANYFYPFRIFGMFPLTMFMTHIIVGLELIKGLEIFRKGSLYQFLLVYILTFIFFTGIGYLWKKAEFRYSLEWLVSIVTYNSSAQTQRIVSEKS